MAKYGCLNKNTNETDFSYVYHRMKALPAPYGVEPYVQYEVLDGTVEDMYIWDEQSQSVIQDPNYTAPTPDYQVIGKRAVLNAIEFGKQFIVNFAGENVAMGITQAGKTGEVLAVMEEPVEYDSVNKPGIKISVMGTLNSGSLYESLAVIDYHISKANNGDYDSLAPFITAARLTEGKQSISDYLGI